MLGHFLRKRTYFHNGEEQQLEIIKIKQRLSGATDEEQIQEETKITVSLFLVILGYIHRIQTFFSNFIKVFIYFQYG